MNNQIELEDIKLWLGELLLENRLLQKELMRLNVELEETKEGLSLSRPSRQNRKGKEEINN